MLMICSDHQHTWHCLNVSRNDRYMIDCLIKCNLFQLHEGKEAESNSGNVEVKLTPTRFSSECQFPQQQTECDLPQFMETGSTEPSELSNLAVFP